MDKKNIQQKKWVLAIMLTFSFFLINLPVHAQNVRVSINMQDVPMERAMNEIEKQTKYLFISNKDVDIKRNVSVNVQNKPLSEALTQMLVGTNIVYKISNSNILLSKQNPSDEKPVTVSGIVYDEQGEAITGAVIAINGSTSGTITDETGSFTLQVPPPVANAVLTVSFMGYDPVNLSVGSRTQFNVTLRERDVVLKDIVVTAFGIERSKKALSYNVQEVTADDIVGVKDANFINALNGKVAGVNINASSSGIGGASKVVMRGSRSIEQSSNALYVIDGVPMSNVTRTGSADQNAFESAGTSDYAADINPEDIESISILTGASAAALYGSSAANGAVVITTKKGAKGKTSVTITQNTEFTDPFVKYDFQNRYGTSATDTNMSWGTRLNNYNFMGYDPYEDYFKTGVVTTETVALSTGNDKNQTYISLGMVNSEGIIPNNEYDRYNFTFRNTTSFLNDKMTLDVGASYIKQRDLNMTNQGVYSNPIASAYLYPRGNDWENVKMFERYDDQRKIYTQQWDMAPGEYVLQNPYWINYRNLRTNKKDRYMINAGLNYKVLDWLTLSGRVRMDNSRENSTRKNYASTNTQLTENSEYGLYGESTLENKQTYADAMVRVNKRFNEDWSLDAFAGASIQDLRTDINGIFGPIRDGSVEGETALIPNVFNILQISNKLSKRDVSSAREQQQSIFASAEVGFKNAYYLTATLRTDWPSQLAGPESVNSSFTYPSVGVSTILSEVFKLPKEISYLKLRASYANVGLAFKRYLSNPTYSWTGTQWSTTYDSYPIKNLKPERTHSYEIGLTSRFLNNFNLDVTLYHTNTLDQLINTGISPGSGYSTMYIQTGDVRNRGIEVSFGYDKKWNNFAWNSNFTFSANRNKVKKLAGNVTNYETGENFSFSHIDMGHLGDVHYLIREGGTLGDLYSSADLVRDADGKIYVDENGAVQAIRGIKDIGQWTKLGSIFPKANLAWRNDFSYKGINLGFLVTARLGGVVFSRTQATLDYYGVSEASALARDNGGVAIGENIVDSYNWYNVVANSDGIPQYYTYSATNVRLQEASIGYTFPRKLLKVCDATISVVGRNLFMIYKKAPFDPESVATITDNYYQGMDYFITPSTRNIGFSVRLKF